MRTLLALALLAPVAVARDEDPVPVAPPPRLKTLATAKKKATPPEVVAPKVVTKVDPTTAPMPKTNPVPTPVPMTVTRVDPPMPKAVPPVEPKAEPKTDAKVEPKTDAKVEPKTDAKDEKPTAAPVPAAKEAEPSFNDWTAPLYAVIAFGVLAVLVVIRSYTCPPKD